MRLLARLLIAALAVLGLAASSASAEERMWIGFHDDPVLRYGPDRLAEMDAVRRANATIVRTLVEWRRLPVDADEPSVLRAVRSAPSRGRFGRGMRRPFLAECYGEPAGQLFPTPEFASTHLMRPWIDGEMGVLAAM